MNPSAELPPRVRATPPLYKAQEPGFAGQIPLTPLPLSKSSMSELQLQVDFFRKLGYSPEHIQAAMMKLGMGKDTNAVLAELVRTGASRSPTPVEWERPVASGSASGSGSESGGGKSPVKAPQIPQHPVSEEEEESDVAEDELKPIVIDGSNVAMSHGNKEVFSCRGIELAVNYFLKRGHKKITVFVPSWRKEPPRPDVPITDQHILSKLEKQKIVVFTPSRRVGGKRVVCYDDRFIVKLAHELDGIIVSNDTYRDLQSEKPEWKRCIEERLLMYSFVNDKFMPPDDPLGRHGPNLDNLLRKKPLLPEHKRQLCPYGKKCTYGVKCKFYHPERASQSQRALADELRDNAKLSSSSPSPTQDGGRGPCQVPVGGATPSSSSSVFGGGSPSLEQQLQYRLTLEPSGGALHQGQVQAGEGPEERWDKAAVVAAATTTYSRNSSSSSCGSSSGVQSDREWLSLLSPFTTDPASVFSSSDSGLGSYEHQQHLHQQQHHQQQHHQQQQQRHHHQQPKDMCRGQARLPSLPSLMETPHPCLACCAHLTIPLQPPALYDPPPEARATLSHLPPSYCPSPTGCLPCHPVSCGYDPPQYPQPPPMHYTSLPSYFGLGRRVRHPKCWSEPPAWMPVDTFTPCSLPESGHPASLPRPRYFYPDQQMWGPPTPGYPQRPPAPAELQPVPPPQPVRLDPEREEVRQKLHAIFNPYQVDKVMSMHPHLKDAQKLAAQILTLKSRGEMF
ncbi:hypothetical protein ACEWY4_020456 [Coilia grayii]|uniref:C3H1-type domain-containing protein n=1 Tax=Coilia grayii TaxID=363190 RepID=A0ABD1JCN4_9TELE